MIAESRSPNFDAGSALSQADAEAYNEWRKREPPIPPGMREFIAAPYLDERFRELDLRRQVDVAIYHRFLVPEDGHLMTLLSLDVAPLRLADALRAKIATQSPGDKYLVMGIDLLGSACQRSHITQSERNILRAEISALETRIANPRARAIARDGVKCQQAIVE